MTFDLPVKARARRRARWEASVPEPVNRTRAAQGISLLTSSAHRRVRARYSASILEFVRMTDMPWLSLGYLGCAALGQAPVRNGQFSSIPTARNRLRPAADSEFARATLQPVARGGTIPHRILDPRAPRLGDPAGSHKGAEPCPIALR